ncbi:MAG: hypothetical protein JNM47_01795 [Hyphomonadaceae bacterium]|nr:hypothetical protein [Hyphomonadaceae bacterium]
MSIVELSIPTTRGLTLRVRIAADDARWREKALANLDPLSPEAFAIRKAPLTAAERAAWDEYCRQQDLIDDLQALASCVHELHAALLELGDFA